MGLIERDPVSGHQTTGHEWNGIKELNTPVPWPVWFFLIATGLFAVVYWVLMPAWPLGRTYARPARYRPARHRYAAGDQGQRGPSQLDKPHRRARRQADPG